MLVQSCLVIRIVYIKNTLLVGRDSCCVVENRCVLFLFSNFSLQLPLSLISHIYYNFIRFSSIRSIFQEAKSKLREKMGDVLQIDSGYANTTAGKYKISCLVSLIVTSFVTSSLIEKYKIILIYVICDGVPFSFLNFSFFFSSFSLLILFVRLMIACWIGRAVYVSNEH